MKTLLFAGMLCTGLLLAGCVVPVAVDSHRNRDYRDTYRSGYRARVDVTPVIEIRP